jgi:CRISPR-associated protein Csb1
MTDLYHDLCSAVALQDERAVLRVRTTYQPAGGEGARIFPPTYPVERNSSSPYVLEERYVQGAVRKDVLLDSVPSQANRAEEALLRARREGRIELPLLEIDHEGAASVRLVSLQLPHRYADAYLMDSEIDGVRFDKTDLGRAFQAASADDASVLLRHDPGSLVFGAWNSHRKGRQAKFPRIYSSEVIGWDPQLGERRAGRMDPLNLTGLGSRTDDGELSYISVGEKTKGKRLSEIGHGNIAPNPAPGGVTVSSAERMATVSLAGLDRIGFGELPAPAGVAARAFLAAYALAADRLAFGGPSLWLRSGCELVTVTETVEWVLRGGGTQPIDLSVAAALGLYERAVAAVADAGLVPEMQAVTLIPGKGLKAAIDFALTKSDGTGE